MLYAYGVRTVVDLRTTEETLRLPCSFADDARFSYDHCNLEGDEPVPGYDLSQKKHPLAYSYSALLAARRSAIRAVFATLADGYQSPTVFFCAGGTDRTGMTAALILGLCGVTDNAIAEDYSLSAQGLVDRFLANGPPPWMPPDDLTSGRALATLARRDTMLDFLHRVRQDYGGVTSYLRCVGVSTEEIDQIRDCLIQ